VANTITLSSNLLFTDTNAGIGRVNGDGALYGYVSSVRNPTDTVSRITLDNVTANSTLNFVGSGGRLMIGRSSGATGVINFLDVTPYDSITPQFSEIVMANTDSTWTAKGMPSMTMVMDAAGMPVTIDVPDEFIDTQRLVLSRSYELQFFSGNASLVISDSLSTSNTAVSPYSDMIRTAATTTHNDVSPGSWLSGYILNTSNTTSIFGVNDTIFQGNSTTNTVATVAFANATSIRCINVYNTNTAVAPSFTTGTIFDATTSANAIVTTASVYNETSNPRFSSSRYISKNVVLATGQDADDLVCFLTAYRPPGTTLHVYGRVLAGHDAEPISLKDWSRLPETSSPSIVSSLVNRNDYVELSFELPQSVEIYSNSVVASATSANVSMPSTAQITAGNFVYIADKSWRAANVVIVVGGTGYANGDKVMLSGTAGYNNANAQFVATTNSTGGVTSLSVIKRGVYSTNTAISANATSNVSGSGTGLTITLNSNSFVQSASFVVRKVNAVANTTNLVLSANTIDTPNSAIGVIPEIRSQTSAFRYTANSGTVRYVTSSDQVQDTFQSFAIKIVPTSNSSAVVPRMLNMRALALQV